MTTTSNVFAILAKELGTGDQWPKTRFQSPVSNVEQHARRILEGFLDRDQRQDRLAPVDDAVIVRQRKVVDGTDGDLTVLGHRPIAGCVYPEDRALRRIDDGRGQHGPEYAAVGDGKRTARQLLDGELPVLGALSEIRDLLLDVGQRELIRIAQYWHHEA